MTALPVGYPGGSGPAAAAPLVLHQADARPLARNAWDAWGDARPDALADVCPSGHRQDVGAGKSVDPAPDGQGPVAVALPKPPVAVAPVAALYKRDAARFAARSCGAWASWELVVPKASAVQPA